MNLYVLDTDILSLNQHEHVSVTAAVEAHRPDVAISVVSAEEQLSGWYTLLRRARQPRELASVYLRMTKALESLSGLRILTFTESAIARYDDLRAMKLHIGKNDLRIAAIALENNAILVTRNVRDFQRVPGLTIEDWSA